MRDHIAYDWEFIDDGRTIEPVSIGMKRRSDGATLYAVSRQFDEAKLFSNPWMVSNVWPHLPTVTCEQKHGGRRFACFTDGQGHLDRDHPDVRPLKQIARMAQQFITEAENPLLWAYYAAYDHVTLAQLWGPMIDLPKGVPMHTMDIKQEMVRLGVESKDMPKRPGQLIRPGEKNPPVQVTAEHDALADAIHNMVMLEHLFAKQDGDPFNTRELKLPAESF